MSNQATYQTHIDSDGEERVFMGWFDHMTQPILGSWRGSRQDLNDESGRGSTPFLSNGVALEGQAVGMRPSHLVETYGEENILVIDVVGPQAVFVYASVYDEINN
jgi:hypothetical protein